MTHFSRRTFGLLALAAAFGRGAGAQSAAPPLGRDETPVTFKDPRLAAEPYTRLWSAYVPRNVPWDKDPKFGTEYPFKLITRTRPTADGEIDIRFEVHFLKPEDEPLARRVGSVLAKTYWTSREYLGLPADGSTRETRFRAQVWLAREGEPGAEAWKGNIYLYAIDSPRAPAEWVRELAHEYSHLILPETGDFKAPERFANGYLGERLLVNWLVQNDHAETLWEKPFNGANYRANQITPLIRSYLDAGPLSDRANRDDADGMNYLIGLVLAADLAHAPAVLRAVLGSPAFLRAPAAPQAYAAAIRKLDDFTVAAEAYIPGKSRGAAQEPGGGVRGTELAYWIHLGGGQWTVTVAGDVPDDLTVEGENLDQKPTVAVQDGTATVQFATPADGGWRRLTFIAPPDTTLTLRQLSFTRRS